MTLEYIYILLFSIPTVFYVSVLLYISYKLCPVGSHCATKIWTVMNLIIVQQDATYSVHYISVGSSTCVGCWHLSSGACMTVNAASGID